MNCGNFGDGCCVNDLNEFSTRFPSMSGVSRNSLSLCSGRAQATLMLQHGMLFCCDRRQGPSRPSPARVAIPRKLTNSVWAASLCSISFPCAVRYRIPQQCFKPLIVQCSLSVGASDKSVYSPLGISPLAPLSCLLGRLQNEYLPLFYSNKAGYEVEFLAEQLYFGCPEFRHLQVQ